MELIDFKYVFCPVIEKEIRLKRAYDWMDWGHEGPKTLVDCVGAMGCGVGSVKDGEVLHDFSQCPFGTVRFMD